MARSREDYCDHEPVSGTVAFPLDRFDALIRSEANFRALTEQAPDGVCVHRGDTCVYANQSFAKLVGRTAESIVGTSITALVHPDDRAVVVERIATPGDTPPAPPVRIRLMRPDGSCAEVEAVMLPIQYDDSSARLCVVHDITATHRIERQLLASERMASVESLASGVAHEINNPLSAVLTNLEFALTRLARSSLATTDAATREELVTALEEAQHGAERVQLIVQGLRTFCPVEDDLRASVDVERTLELALGMASNEIRHRARLQRRYVAVPRVEANEARLAQVFVNLVLNAAQAIPEGKASENEILVATYLEDDRVVVEIGDTGVGMPRDVVERIFDPFFTTKPVGVGTGLGLSVARNVVRSLGGDIDVDTRVGIGTTFRIRLPRARPALRHASTQPESTIVPRRLRVLVIDDEPLVGSSIRRILSGTHDVEVVTRAAEALEKIRTGTTYDAILCDLMMPELTGMDVYETLAQEFPVQASKMIFLTGGVFTDRAREFVEARPHRVVSKPFKPQRLKDIIAAMIVE